MDWIQILTQAGFVVLKEGVNFVFSKLKEKTDVDDSEAREEAKIIIKEDSDVGIEEAKKSEADALHWSSVATLFWLGNDLMWIQDMMYRGALPERVLQGLRHAKQYFFDLGFVDKSFPIQQLKIGESILVSLEGNTELTPEKIILLQQHYGTVDQYITQLKWYVNAHLERQQPGFEKLRAL